MAVIIVGVSTLLLWKSMLVERRLLAFFVSGLKGELCKPHVFIQSVILLLIVTNCPVIQDKCKLCVGNKELFELCSMMTGALFCFGNILNNVSKKNKTASYPQGLRYRTRHKTDCDAQRQ